MPRVRATLLWKRSLKAMVLYLRVLFVAFAYYIGGFLVNSASALPDETAYESYIAGDYEKAVSLAQKAGGSENLALAARALNSSAYFIEERKTARRLADRAFDYSEAAIEAEPMLVEAYLQSAIALALRGSNMASVKVFFKNIPNRARSRIDRALELEPENPWALSTSAAWHLEVVRAGVGRFYGAKRQTGFEQFKKAHAIAPNNISVAYECALRLLASENEEWRVTALAALNAALMIEPQTAFEAKISAQAIDLSMAVKNGRVAEKAFIDAKS